MFIKKDDDTLTSDASSIQVMAQASTAAKEGRKEQK